MSYFWRCDVIWAVFGSKDLWLVSTVVRLQMTSMDFKKTMSLAVGFAWSVQKNYVFSIQMHQHWIFLWLPFIFKTWSSSPRVSRAPSRTGSSPWETDPIRRTDWDRATSRKCTLRSLAVYGSDEFVRILFRQDEKATVPKIGQALGWQQILKVQYFLIGRGPCVITPKVSSSRYGSWMPKIIEFGVCKLAGNWLCYNCWSLRELWQGRGEMVMVC